MDNKFSFTGKTKIFAISDSHQDTRKTRAFLSEVINRSKSDDNILLLNCGDMFKGIYPRELESDSYTKTKQLAPNVEIVSTLGNNDFGFNKESVDYLVDTVKNFTKKGIHMVCANIFETGTGKRPEWLKPYTTVNRDGDKTLVTGFCINNINTQRFGLYPKKQEEVLEEIKGYIEKEKPDNVIVLNHDYMSSSLSLQEAAEEKGVHFDAIIGGHDHNYIKPDVEKHIFYPQSFSDSMYEFELNKDGSAKTLENLKVLKQDDVHISKELEADLIPFEKETELLEDFAPSILNLEKRYSEPCSMGTFFADEMKNMTNSEIAMFSSGFMMKPIPYQEAPLTNYDFKKLVIGNNPIQKVELGAEDLKEIFEHSYELRTKDIEANSRFLQCSSNLGVEGICDKKNGKFIVNQLYVDGQPLLDENGKALNGGQKISCAIDSYIGGGGQGFEILDRTSKENCVYDNKELTIDNVFRHALSETALQFTKGDSYPKYKIIEEIIN
ncbi:MAG: 5'-nucleotidase C-terminal domain-containing protein [Candidatus Gastranaerophilales bacterium]|nr:5'-nucleotidase C-terminal domain-containing protein [Candidatus Gastranaerophilales bacterium]